MEFTDNAMATILLCSHLGLRDQELTPYTLKEWNILVDKLLYTEYKDPSALLGQDVDQIINTLHYTKDQEVRLKKLLSRGGSVALTLDELSRKGIYVVTRGDKSYPLLLRKRLMKKTPPILFYVGDLSLINKVGIAIVGSRNIDNECEEYTKKLVKKAVSEKLIIFSGGARGIDNISETTALESGSAVVSFVADALTTKIKKIELIPYIQRGKMLLISDVNPDVGFTAARAMNRNKYIYTSSCGAFVIASDYNKGGTWTGATENLTNNWVKTLVWDQKRFRGNVELIYRGAKPIDNLDNESILELIAKKETFYQEDLFSYQNKQSLISEGNDYDTPQTDNEKNEINNQNTQQIKDIYPYVIQHIMDVFKEPITIDNAAEILNINKSQLQVWIKRGIDTGIIEKSDKPVRYKAIQLPINSVI